MSGNDGAAGDTEVKMKRPTNSIEAFCKQHGACIKGREWALANCKDMAEAWDKAKPEWLIWIATRDGVLDDRTLRLFACWCARQVWHLLTDERSRNAVEVAERYANGAATGNELAAAAEAWAAAVRATWAAAGAAEAEAAGAAEAEAEAAMAAQAAHLRKSVANPFKATRRAG